MKIIKEYYFKTHTEWRAWLHDHHASNKGVHLIFYSVSHEQQSMRWEEAVKVALCYGWIDSTVKSLGDGKRRQYFCPRKPKSPWSKLNKKHLQELIATGKMHTSGLNKIAAAKRMDLGMPWMMLKMGLSQTIYKQLSTKSRKPLKITMVLQEVTERVICTGLNKQKGQKPGRSESVK